MPGLVHDHAYCYAPSDHSQTKQSVRRTTVRQRMPRWSLEYPCVVGGTEHLSEKLQQNHDIDFPTISTLSNETILRFEESPTFDQFLLVPASFHRAATRLIQKVDILPGRRRIGGELATAYIAPHDSFAYIEPLCR